MLCLLASYFSYIDEVLDNALVFSMINFLTDEVCPAVPDVHDNDLPFVIDKGCDKGRRDAGCSGGSLREKPEIYHLVFLHLMQLTIGM